MPAQHQHASSVLTKSERRVFGHILESAAETGRVTISTRHLAAALDLSRATVQSAVARLNDLGLLNTIPGSPIRTSEHVLSLAVLDGGQ